MQVYPENLFVIEDSFLGVGYGVSHHSPRESTTKKISDAVARGAIVPWWLIPFFTHLDVGPSVAAYAKSDQIALGIVPQPTSGNDMVDLKVLNAAALLAPPAIALQHLLAKLAIGFRSQANAGSPGA